jgi:ABC-type transporter Mla MlaB component
MSSVRHGKEAGMTLRITRESESRFRVTLRLDGRLVGEWAVLLERECAALRRGSATVLIDLAAVRFVDLEGIAVLRRLDAAGTEIHCPPGAVASVLEAEGVRLAPSDDANRP